MDLRNGPFGPPSHTLGGVNTMLTMGPIAKSMNHHHHHHVANT
jgi:hypothetical protein